MRSKFAVWTAVLAMAAALFPGSAYATPDTAWCDAATRYSTARRGVAVLVLENGKVICESNTAARAAPYELWSGTKSFVGVLAAAAVQDDFLSLDELAADTLTEWRDDPRKRTITIRQLLSMTSGQPSVIGKPPTYRGALDVPLTTDPGERFQYGATPLQTFGEIMKRKLKASGRSDDILEYLGSRILRPIGFHYDAWRMGADGNPLLPQGMVARASEWAKFGEFIRAGGRVHGKRIVDRATFAAMFRGSAAHPGYGLTWWLPHASRVPDPITSETDIGAKSSQLPRDLVMAAGAGDQRLYIIPSRNLVIVRQATLDLAALAAGQVAPSGWSDADFLITVLRR